jgi:hypothetical protein
MERVTTPYDLMPRITKDGAAIVREAVEN